MRIEIVLRPVTPEDEPFLLALFASTRPEIAQLGWGEAEQQAFCAMQAQMQKRAYGMQYPGAEHSIILCDGTPAGRLIVDRNALEIRLIDIAVLPGSRGRGIATEMIGRLQNEAERELIPVRLSVETTNSNALGLYRKLGFEVTGENQTHLAMQWLPTNHP